MKKTTLLIIGACAFVLQSATAQINLYYDDFEGQTIGAMPSTTPFAGANAGLGVETGGIMPWYWVGAGGGDGIASSSFTVQSVLSTDGLGSTLAAVLAWTEGPLGGNNWFGFSQPDHCSVAADPANTLADLTLSFDVAISGNDLASATAPVTVWFDQFPGGVKTFDASYSPNIAALTDPDTGWAHVSFTLDQLVQSGTSGAYDPTCGFQICFDGGAGVSLGASAVGTIYFDNIVLSEAVPEPATIALLTLGGLGALVALRRRA